MVLAVTNCGSYVVIVLGVNLMYASFSDHKMKNKILLYLMICLIHSGFLGGCMALLRNILSDKVPS